MTVQEAVYKLAQKIDPRIKSTGAAFTAATVCTVDGERYTAQRLLDIYNEARFALFKALENGLSKEELTLELGGLLPVGATVIFNGQVAEKPEGLIQFISMTTQGNVPVLLLPATMTDVVRSGLNPNYVESATNKFIFEQGTYYASIGGESIMPSPTTCNIVYLGLSAFTLTDVTAGTTVETINVKYYPIVLELAQAIAEEQGSIQVNQLATKLLGGQ